MIKSFSAKTYTKMKKIILIAVILCIIPTISYSLTLYSSKIDMVDEIIRSIENEPDNWFIGSSVFIYTDKPKYLKELIAETWPEMNDKSVLVMDLHMDTEPAYFKFDKPDIGFLSNHSDEEDAYRKLERVVKKKLYEKYKKELNIKNDCVSEKTVVEDVVTEKTVNGMKKL